MKVETINLSNLPEHWKKLASKVEAQIPKSNDPLVDGTSMTINPEIKHRRKRIVSQQNYKTKRPRIAEFINACKFLAGETSKIFPLSTQHQNLLSLIRHGKEIPEKYQSVVNHNIEIVQKAAQLKPKEIKEKYYTVTVPLKEKEIIKMQRKVNSNNVRTSEQAGIKFKAWLQNNLSDVPFEEKQEDMRYASIVSYYKNHNGLVPDYMPKCSKAILDEYVNKIQNYVVSKNRLKKVNEENVDARTVETCDASKVNITPVTLPEQVTKVTDTITEPTTHTQIITEPLSKVNDTLSMVIMLAKKAGATELIIKL